MSDLRERMAAIKATAATPVRPVKPLITSAPRRGGLVAYTVENCKRLSIEDLERLSKVFKDRPDMTVGEQVAAIIGCTFNPVPDYLSDRGVAFILEEWLVFHGCRVSRQREYWSRLCTDPDNYTEVWMPMASKTIKQHDHNLALCQAVIAYYAFQLAVAREPDHYDGVVQLDLKADEWAHWVNCHNKG